MIHTSRLCLFLFKFSWQNHNSKVLLFIEIMSFDNEHFLGYYSSSVITAYHHIFILFSVSGVLRPLARMRRRPLQIPGAGGLGAEETGAR